MPKPQQIFSEGNKLWLTDDAVVWRYVPFRTLFFYLNGLVFIPSIAKLQTADPFEGQFYDEIAWFNRAFSLRYGDKADEVEKWILKNLCSEAERKVIELNKNDQNGSPGPLYIRHHYFRLITQTRFAWCWFHSDRESAAMWNVYGNQGVAIKTTIGKLRALFENAGRSFIYGRMVYVDHEHWLNFDPSIVNEQFLLRPFFLKRKEYASENEVRFITAASERERGGLLMKNLQAEKWISAIRLWPGLTNDEENSLCKAIKYFLPKIDCEKSNLFSVPNGSSDVLNELINSDLEKQADSDWEMGADKIPAPLKNL